MNTLLYNIEAVTGLLLDNSWLALLVIGAGVAAIDATVAGARQWLTATPASNSSFTPVHSFHSQ